MVHVYVLGVGSICLHEAVRAALSHSGLLKRAGDAEAAADPLVHQRVVSVGDLLEDCAPQERGAAEPVPRDLTRADLAGEFAGLNISRSGISVACRRDVQTHRLVGHCRGLHLDRRGVAVAVLDRELARDRRARGSLRPEGPVLRTRVNTQRGKKRKGW